MRDFVSWSRGTEMADPVIVALTASFGMEYLSTEMRLTPWLLILVVGSMQTVGTTVTPKCVTKTCQN